MAAGPKGFSKKCVAVHEHKVVFFFLININSLHTVMVQKKALNTYQHIDNVDGMSVFFIASVLSNSIEKVSNYQTSDNLNQTIQNIQIICICLSSVSASTQAP